MTFQASQFTRTGTSGTITLPVASPVYTPPSIAATETNSATPPVDQCGPTLTACTPLDGGGGVPMLHAVLGAGQGAWTMTQANTAGGDLALTIPANASAGTYTSDLTFTWLLGRRSAGPGPNA